MSTFLSSSAARVAAAPDAAFAVPITTDHTATRATITGGISMFPFRQNKIPFPGNKHKYKFVCDVMSVIFNNKGGVFGGAVRDRIKHDDAASAYYAAFSKPNIHNVHNIVDDYTNIAFLPETLDRLLVPFDIDAFISTANFQKMVDDLVTLNISFDIEFWRDASRYFPNTTVQPDQVKHCCITLKPFSKDINTKIMSAMPPSVLNMPIFTHLLQEFTEKLSENMFDVKLDLMVINNSDAFTLDAPFGELDFECNGLIMDARGIRLSDHMLKNVKNPIARQRELARIMDDILKKKAVLCSRATTARIDKMISKGWSVQSENIQLVHESYTAEVAESSASSEDGSSMSGGYCLICQDDCNKEHYKLKCCDARYHAGCMLKCWENCVVTKSRCPMCRARTFETTHDISHLEYIAESVHVANVEDDVSIESDDNEVY